MDVRLFSAACPSWMRSWGNVWGHAKRWGVGEREHEKMSAGYVLNTKDRSPNTGAAGKGLLRVCASCNVGPHARSAENSLRSTKQR
jgi:hypothetical protein